jgi:hypothetical protein
MSREIKFRAWDKKTNMMLPSEDHNLFCITDDGWWLMYYLDGEQTYVGDNKSCLKSEGDILMQYTGLKDKNGVEIYEGDRLAPFGAEVIWSEKMLCWCGKHKNDNHYFPLYTDNLKRLEVIGNIYENPELMKK